VCMGVCVRESVVNEGECLHTFVCGGCVRACVCVCVLVLRVSEYVYKPVYGVTVLYQAVFLRSLTYTDPISSYKEFIDNHKPFEVSVSNVIEACRARVFSFVRTSPATRPTAPAHPPNRTQMPVSATHPLASSTNPRSPTPMSITHASTAPLSRTCSVLTTAQAHGQPATPTIRLHLTHTLTSTPPPSRTSSIAVPSSTTPLSHSRKLVDGQGEPIGTTRQSQSLTHSGSVRRLAVSIHSPAPSLACPRSVSFLVCTVVHICDV